MPEHCDPAGDPAPLDARLTALPTSPLATAVLAEVVATESAALAHHSVRSFLFARLLAHQSNAVDDSDYDEDLLFAACALHDIGLARSTGGTQRFEVEGADRAARFLAAHGVPGHQVDTIWEAVALHTSFGIAERRGLLCRLTRAGVGMDFGYGVDAVSDDEANAIHAPYPRLELERTLVDAIVEQATLEPTRAPRYSMSAVLVGQRVSPPHVSQIEAAAAHLRWTADPVDRPSHGERRAQPSA